jgi:hypothetical protein
MAAGRSSGQLSKEGWENNHFSISRFFKEGSGIRKNQVNGKYSDHDTLPSSIIFTKRGGISVAEPEP